MVYINYHLPTSSGKSALMDKIIWEKRWKFTLFNLKIFFFLPITTIFVLLLLIGIQYLLNMMISLILKIKMNVLLCFRVSKTS